MVHVGVGGVEPPRAWTERPAPPTPGISIDPRDWPTRSFLGFAQLLSGYHRHQVFHLERLEQLFHERRRVIVVGNHALDIVDPLLFLAQVYRRLGRVPYFVGHEKGWFGLPVLRHIAEHFHVIPSRQLETTATALRRAGFLMLYPGGNREAGMRSYRDEPYRLKWEERSGFLRLALEAEAEIVFVAAVGTDEAYYQSRLATPQALIRWVNGGDGTRYRGMRLSFGLLGAHLVPGLFPLPVKLTHFVSSPLYLGDRERARRDPEAFARLHRRTWVRCQTFLDAVVSRREAWSDGLDRSVRSFEGMLQELGL